MGSLFFIGYALGVIFFFLPDKYGRKSTMKFMIPLVTIGQYLTIFCRDIQTKGIGLLMIGLFHLRNTNSYTHILELVRDKDKNMVTTMLTAFDSGTPFFACMGLLICKDEDLVLTIYFWIGIVASVIYFITITESPRWLLINHKCK